jgi:hypothetical protein
MNINYFIYNIMNPILSNILIIRSINNNLLSCRGMNHILLLIDIWSNIEASLLSWHNHLIYWNTSLMLSYICWMLLTLFFLHNQWIAHYVCFVTILNCLIILNSKILIDILISLINSLLCFFLTILLTIITKLLNLI